MSRAKSAVKCINEWGEIYTRREAEQSLIFLVVKASLRCWAVGLSSVAVGLVRHVGGGGVEREVAS